MSVQEEARRLVKAQDELRSLQAFRQAKIHMIALWQDEIHAIDARIAELIKADPHLAGSWYPAWLQEIL